jgi:dUTP pyrophosphatase
MYELYFFAKLIRGNVGVILFNHGIEPFSIKKGDRIAQLILECIKNPIVEEVTDLPQSDRGTGGFGSTGK